MSPWLIGVPEAALAAALISLGVGIPLGAEWGIGVLWGSALVISGRILGWLYFPFLLGSRRPVIPAMLMAGSRLLFYAVAAIGGIALGLSPLGISLGLLIPGLVLKMRLLISPKGKNA